MTWTARCPHCGQWTVVPNPSPTVDLIQSRDDYGHNERARNPLAKLSDIKPRALPRYRSGIEALDATLGGGFVRGDTLIISGDPGIGKSTLLLQALAGIGTARKCAYYTAEENEEKISLRAERIGLVNAPVHVMRSDDVNEIITSLEHDAIRLAVVDSIQAIQDDALDTPKGGIAQMRECALMLIEAAQQLNTTVILACHVAKDGTIAGPRTIEHLVDAVIYLEDLSATEVTQYFEGDELLPHPGRLVGIHATKNRNGPTLEQCKMRMTEKGMVSV